MSFFLVRKSTEDCPKSGSSVRSKSLPVLRGKIASLYASGGNDRI